MAKKLPWFRLYSETLNDRKLSHIARSTKQPKALILGVWSTLLCLANDSPVPGDLLLACNVTVTFDDLLHETGVNVATLGNIITAFGKLEMLHVNNDVYSIASWNKRQFKSDSSAERVKRFRAKQPSNNDVTLPKRSSNLPDTDTDTDTDLIIEEEEAPTERPNIFKLYEQNIGALTPLISDKLREAEKDYDSTWIEEAFLIAVENNVHKWNYVNAILKDWKTNGRDDNPKKRKRPKSKSSSNPNPFLDLEV